MANSSHDAEYKVYLFPLVIAMPFIVTYLITSLFSSIVFRSWRKIKRPPLAPYWVPVLGHALSFFWDTSVVGDIQTMFGDGIVGIQLFTTRINFVTGSENIAALWRSKDLDAKAVTSFSLKEFFSTPERSMKVYLGDSSGINPQPHPKGNLALKDRYYYQNRKAIVGFFNGPGLKSMGNRFAALLNKEIRQTDIGSQWTKYEDLYGFIQKLLIGPAVEAMCGPVLLEQNPTFGDDFWKIDRDILYFFKSYPWWLIPRAYENRTKLLDSVKKWHAFARDNFDASCVEPDGHDRFYGSPLMRTRQEYLSKIKYLDADSIASQDLGLLWAENANSIPAVFWMMYEALQRPHVLSQALDEVIRSQSCSSLNQNPTMDVESLCRMPLLQSMYVETLRLYTSLFALRSAPHGDFDFAHMKIHKDELVAVDSRVAAMNSNVWNTGSTNAHGESSHPLSQFWAERLLAFPDDPKSGPLRSTSDRKNDVHLQSASSLDGKTPHFTLDGLVGAWLPYGGGNRQCPGRNFAKQEIILGFAIMFSMLDIELLDQSDANPRKPDMRYYGLGTLPPKGRIPFRVRKR